MLLDNVIKDSAVKAKKIVYELSEECVRAHPLIAKSEDPILTFYAWLRQSMNVDKSFNMDCTKINVANNIQDAWIEYAANSGIDNVSINMTLLNYAPRVDDKLNDNEICIYDGFFVKSEENK